MWREMSRNLQNLLEGKDDNEKKTDNSKNSRNYSHAYASML